MAPSDSPKQHVMTTLRAWYRAWRAKGPPSGGPPPGHARLDARRAEIIGLLIGLSIGSVVLFATPVHSGHRGDPAKQPADGARQPVNPEPDPAALDAEWAAYSAHSTCADWAGGDGISAVRLDPSQIAWFFSDTYLGPAGPAAGFSRSAGLLHNSVVIQTVTGQRSRFATVTGGGTCDGRSRPVGQPFPVVSSPAAPGGPGGRYWEEDGVMIGGAVIKFYDRYSLGNAPYVPTGTVLAAFPAGGLAAAGRSQVGEAVAKPRIIPLPPYTPPGGNSPITWGAAVLRSGNTIYIYGTQTPDTAVPDRLLYLARVPASRLTQFSAWRFYVGGTWVAAQQGALPLQPAGSGLTVSSGFSVVRAGQRYWLIQADPLAGSQDIDAYPAAVPWGPFDRASGVVLYRNADIGADAAHDYRIMYEARAELALSTSRTLVISYNVNSLGVTTGCVPMSWFTNTVTQPRFITVPMAALSAARGGQDDAATTAAPDYPHVAARDPAQWFDAWDYRSGCPPVPAVTSVRARPGSGTVQLSWRGAGLGVGYRVYVLPHGADSYQLKVTTGADSVTFSGLPAGRCLARVVQVNSQGDTGPPAQVAITIP